MPGATETSAPTGVYALDGDSDRGWSAEFSQSLPEIGYRVTDEGGSIVAEGAVQVEWVRIDGTEQCGGNVRAEIHLDF